MEADTANRYRSRILREMNANRDNPFNSPPSSTGSHGTVSPTISSVFSDPDGESTRKLNEDIARVTAPRKLPVNWEAAHRKWPEFYSMPKARDAPLYEDVTDTRPLSSESKENNPPASGLRFSDDSTHDIWQGSKRTRAEMQPRVDEGSDLSSILAKPPTRGHSYHGLTKNTRNPSPLAKGHTRAPSAHYSDPQRRPSISDALDRLRRASLSPKNGDQNEREQRRDHGSPHISSAKSSLTAVPPSHASVGSPGHNASHARSFFMPDVSHLGDFVEGTLRFSGSMKNGVPVFVKHGKVHDRQERPSTVRHAAVDGVEVPEDEEKIFVSMDMIRDEIVSLQGHYDKVHEYAEDLQKQVEKLESQAKSRKYSDGGFGSDRANEHLMTQKNRLEVEVETLQSRLEQASRKASLSQIENESLTHEKDRAVKKLQEACDDISKLTRKLSSREKDLESTDQMREDNDTLRRDLISLKHGRDALELEIESLRAENEAMRREQTEPRKEMESLRSDNNTLRREQQSLISENISLRSNNKALMDENEDLRDNLDGVQHELDAAREEVDTLRQELETVGQEKTTLREDNSGLVRHNNRYFEENKVLRRENTGFERSVHDLHDENLKLKDEIQTLKEELDHCRPVPKEDFSARLDEETEENMTSAFFIPDITMNSNGTSPAEPTETKDMPAPPELTSQSTKQQDTGHQRTKSKSKNSIPKNVAPNQKVSFALPDHSQQSINVANQGSKRRSAAPRDYHNAFSGEDDTTGLLSLDDTTQDQSVPLDSAIKIRMDANPKDRRQSRADVMSQSQKSQHTRSQSQSSAKRTSAHNLTNESVKFTTKDSCPALSADARQVLDNLCEHNCRNCIVCTRITAHAGVISAHDFATGKKRVTVSRPVPVTDRDLSVEDPTMRPANSPGHALALVIKGLEDEAHHMQLELSRLQAQYNGSDKALGRRDRVALAEGIRTLLKRLEVKNDQIYSLYDVLEGQKAAGQAMSEEEIEMTVLSITGMTVRDVTSHSEQLTWEGIQEV